MIKLLKNPYFIFIIRFILGAVFILASVSKIANPNAFAGEIENYNILPQLLINPMAMAIPWIELIVGIFLVAGIRQRSSAAVSAILYFVFIVAIAGALIQGLDINCGCHTKVLSDEAGIQKFFENIGMLILSAIVFLYPSRKLSLENIIIRDAELEYDE
ncbi:MAG: DoxX family membrane protein [Candidatus Kapabacteria bacterium]|jgi:putative oxidoreductase|nr:DoxX family membrane protein [Candidatus Kapabacteria bacterium]